MSVVLTGAHEALKLANHVTGKKDSLVLQEGKQRGRSGRHWSYKVQVAGAITGALVGVVAAIAGLIPLAIISAILFVTNAIGAYYVRKFDLMNDLEDYVDEMARRINEMAGHITELKQVNKNLEQVNLRIGHNIDRTKTVFDDGVKRTENELSELADLQKKYDHTLESLQRVSEMYADLQNSVNAFSNEVGALSQGKNELSDEVNRLAGHVTSGADILRAVDAEGDDLGALVAQMDANNAANAQFLNRITREIERLVTLLNEAQSLRATLDNKGGVVLRAAEELNQATKRTENALKKREELQQRANEMNQKTELLTGAIDELLQQMRAANTE